MLVKHRNATSQANERVTPEGIVLAEHPELSGLTKSQLMYGAGSLRHFVGPLQPEKPRSRGEGMIKQGVCSYCGGRCNLKSTKRRYCSDACKQAAYRESKGLRHGWGNYDGSPALKPEDLTGVTLGEVIARSKRRPETKRPASKRFWNDDRGYLNGKVRKDMAIVDKVYEIIFGSSTIGVSKS